MANKSADIQSLAARLMILGSVGGALSFLGIFVPWFHSGVNISGLNLGAEDETVYVIALALPLITAAIMLTVSYRRQSVYPAVLALAFSVVAFMLFWFVLAHTASGTLSSGENFQYYAVLRLSEYRLGFFFIVIGQALSLVSALSNLVLKIALGVITSQS